jgi:hypothetical protein
MMKNIENKGITATKALKNEVAGINKLCDIKTEFFGRMRRIRAAQKNIFLIND